MNQEIGPLQKTPYQKGLSKTQIIEALEDREIHYLLTEKSKSIELENTLKSEPKQSHLKYSKVAAILLISILSILGIVHINHDKSLKIARKVTPNQSSSIDWKYQIPKQRLKEEIHSIYKNRKSLSKLGQKGTFTIEIQSLKKEIKKVKERINQGDI